MDGWTRLIYFVCCDPGASDKVLAILPDSYSSSGLISSKFRSAFGIGRLANGRESRHRYQAPFLASVSHDAVLVLDPNPSENFGHPVALFYVDFNVTKKRCSHLDGIYLGESGWMGFRCIWFVIDTTMAFSKAQTSTEARTFTDTQRLNILAKMKISAHHLLLSSLVWLTPLHKCDFHVLCLFVPSAKRTSQGMPKRICVMTKKRIYY